MIILNYSFYTHFMGNNFVRWGFPNMRLKHNHAGACKDQKIILEQDISSPEPFPKAIYERETTKR